MRRVARHYPYAITPYFLSLILWQDSRDPIRMQGLPSLAEILPPNGGSLDPLSEEEHTRAPGLIHRYPDRVLWVIVHECAMLCRHCTRKRKVGERPAPISEEQLDAGIAYLQANPAIRDVLLSGGDPFLLSDDRLEHVLKRLRSEVPSAKPSGTQTGISAASSARSIVCSSPIASALQRPGR